MASSLLTSSLPEPSNFIDTLCGNLSLSESQNLDLQAVAQIGQGLERGSLLLHLVTQANIFHLQNSVNKLLAQDTSTASVLQDFKNQVTDKWALNEDDKVVVLKVVKDVLMDVNRASFSNAKDEVYTKLDTGKAAHRLTHAFKTPARIKTLKSHIRQTTNNMKGSLRRMALETAAGDNAKDLYGAVRKIESSLKMSFGDTQRVRITARVSLWRRYVRETNRRPTKRTNSGTEKEDSQTETFWDGFDEWLKKVRAEKNLGDDFGSEAWRKYLDETRILDANASKASIAAPVPQPSMPMLQGIESDTPTSRTPSNLTSPEISQHTSSLQGSHPRLSLSTSSFSASPSTSQSSLVLSSPMRSSPVLSSPTPSHLHRNSRPMSPLPFRAQSRNSTSHFHLTPLQNFNPDSSASHYTTPSRNGMSQPYDSIARVYQAPEPGLTHDGVSRFSDMEAWGHPPSSSSVDRHAASRAAQRPKPWEI
ncbi:hypothetical protein D9758_013456 [Tetrapyrgos nigripes]|uniref:Uncharacterized protein n=1 Tax=Tetrapyrgos nigripes TaxID=182062 RepID=A0A8H5CPV7_9AGAR|nr:hypothetical protein D9758_011905 [Tetrapyrgos nigripes]KAF5346567.1 hypothetical protein D9758_013456 [Tetrapyrgos nigripes]